MNPLYIKPLLPWVSVHKEILYTLSCFRELLIDIFPSTNQFISLTMPVLVTSRAEHKLSVQENERGRMRVMQGVRL